jgi:hypothetical protein
VRAESLGEAVGWASRYISMVGAEQVEVREIVEQP